MLKKSGKYPCALCCSGFGSCSLECSQWNLWVHRRCSGIDGRTVTEMDIEDTMLDVEATLWYLCSGGGCDNAMAAKYCMVRGKCVCSAMLHGSETWGPTLLTCSAGPPQWPYNDPLDQWHQKRRLNTLSFATTKSWHWGYYSSILQKYRMPCPVPNLFFKQTFLFPRTRGRGRPKKHVLNMRRLMLIFVAGL